MKQITGEAITSLFQEEEDVEEEECACDITFGALLDSSLELNGDHLTSTPKQTDISNLESDASTPVSFLRPNYSALSVEDEPSIDGNSSSTGFFSPQLNAISPDQTECDPEFQPPTDSCHSVNISNNRQQSFVQTVVADPETDADPSSSKDNVGGVKLVGDNVDKTVKTRYMRIDQQGRSLHYFHAYAMRDRFDLSMPEEAPSIPNNPDLSQLLPSSDDKSTITQLFAIHVARVLSKHMPFFSEDFGDVVPDHIEHPMSSTMSKKSEVVSNYNYIN